MLVPIAIPQNVHNFPDSVANAGDRTHVSFDFHPNNIHCLHRFIELFSYVPRQLLHPFHKGSNVIEGKAQEGGEPQGAKGEDNVKNIFGVHHMGEV